MGRTLERDEYLHHGIAAYVIIMRSDISVRVSTTEGKAARNAQVAQVS